MLFATSARIVKFDAVVVANYGEVVRVEESSGVCEFRAFVAVLEAAARITHLEINVELVTRRECGCQLVDRVKIVGLEDTTWKGRLN